MPHHYVEVASLLFNAAPDDIPQVDLVRTLLEDVEQLRQSKINKGVKAVGEGQAQLFEEEGRLHHFVQFPRNISAMELNRVRPTLLKVMDSFHGLVALRKTQEQRLKERQEQMQRQAFAAQQRGLDAVDDRTGRPRRPRVSRLLVLADDGADRFYRQVDQLLTQHAPRVIAVRLAVDEVTLGQRFFGPQQAARLLMVDHKDAVAKTLEAIADRWGPSNAG